MAPVRGTQRRKVSAKRRPGRRAAARGTAALEMVLVLPFVVFCALATTDFGRVMHAYLVVSNAARCGAETGSMHKLSSRTRPVWESQVQQAIDEEMSGLHNFVSDNLSTSFDTTIDSDGLTRVNVQVNYSFHTLVSTLR